MTDQLMGVLVQNLVQMGGHDRAGVNHGVTQRLGLIALADLDPHRFEAKGRVLGGDAVERAKHLPRVDCHFSIRVNLGLGQNHAHQGQAVGAGGQIKVVANVHGGHQKAQILRKLLAHALDPRQQLTTLIAVHQRNKSITHFKANHVDRRDVIPTQLFGLLGTGRGRQQVLLQLHFLQGLSFGCVLLLPHQIRHATGDSRQAQKGEVRHARHDTHDRHQARRHRQGFGRGKHLPVDLLAHVFGAGGTGNHNRRSGGQQQRRQLRHQTVTDGQQGVNLAGVGKGHAVLKDTHGYAADQVNKQDKQTGDGITAHEFTGAVHRAVELGLLGDFLTTQLGLILIDQARVEVSINGHLLTGHGVEGEACAHLGNAPGTFGHNHKVDDHQNGEDHDTNDIIAADHHLAKGLNHLAGRGMAVLTVEHDHSGGSHVECQAHQRRDQQNSGEYREIQRAQRVDADQQHNDGEGNVEGKEHIEEKRRNRQHHHCQHHQQQQRHAQLPLPQTGQAITGCVD